jgi:hypothetical protein
MAQFWQIAPARERRSRCPLEPVLGNFLRVLDLFFIPHLY